jgi:hypothetical protein
VVSIKKLMGVLVKKYEMGEMRSRQTMLIDFRSFCILKAIWRDGLRRLDRLPQMGCDATSFCTYPEPSVAEQLLRSCAWQAAGRPPSPPQGRPILPRDGQAGDLMATVDRQDEATLWFCVRSGNGTTVLARWAQVLLGDQFEQPE